MLRRLQWRVDALEPSELLGASTRLLRALTRAETVDVLLGFRDLLVLPGRRLHERRVPVGALPRVLRVSTAVLDDL